MQRLSTVAPPTTAAQSETERRWGATERSTDASAARQGPASLTPPWLVGPARSVESVGESGADGHQVFKPVCPLFTMVDEGAVTDEVVSAVARAEGIDPTDVEPPLFESVDATALARLFRDTSGHITFEYGGYVVTVDSDGAVTLDPHVT